MSFPDDSTIEHLALRMIDRTLPKSEWTHAAHFALALWLLRHRGDLAEPDAMRRLIMSYNDATGTANTESSGYHHTITLASMRAAASLLDRMGPDTPLHVTLRALMASKLGRPDWILTYWNRDTLFSAKTRREWVEPDRMPLPF